MNKILLNKLAVFIVIFLFTIGTLNTYSTNVIIPTTDNSGPNATNNSEFPLNPGLYIGNNVTIGQEKIVDDPNSLNGHNIAMPVTEPASRIMDSLPTPIVAKSTPDNKIIPNPNSPQINNYTTATFTTKTPTISAESAILINATTKEIYFTKEHNKQFEPAGIINLMTAYLGIQNKQINDILTVSKNAVTGIDKDASIAALNVGDTITLKDAIASMFVKSCVDSANVVATNVSNDINSFVTLMNDTAIALGCQNTHFTNPNGLNDDNQLTTAYDMALIMNAVTDNQDLHDLLTLSHYTLPAAKKRDALTIYTKNTILSKESPNYNKDIECSRMGFTSKTRYTITSSFTYKDNKFITVVLKANGTQFSDTKKLVDFAKAAYDEKIPN